MQSEKKSIWGSFYGWVILVVSLFILAIVFGIRYSYGVFFKALQVDFSWNRVTTAGAYSTHMIFSSFIVFLWGWAFDKYGLKKVVALSGLITGISLVLTSQVKGIYQLYFTYGFLLALGISGIWTILMANTSVWFKDRRGLALGIISSGAGLGPLVIAPIVDYFNSNYDWRVSFSLLGLAAWFIVIPSAFLLEKPISFKFDSNSRRKLNSENKSPSVSNKEFEFTIIDAFRTKQLWLIFLVWFCFSFVLHTVMIHVVAGAIDVGMRSTSAATIISVISGFSVLGRLIMGQFSDFMGRRKISVGCALLQAIAILWLIVADEPWMFYLFALAYGFGYGGLDPTLTALISDIFGFLHIGKIVGATVIGWGIGGMIGPIFAGYVFDINKGYSFAYASGFFIMLFAAILMLFLKPLIRK